MTDRNKDNEIITHENIEIIIKTTLKHLNIDNIKSIISKEDLYQELYIVALLDIDKCKRTKKTLSKHFLYLNMRRKAIRLIKKFARDKDTLKNIIDTVKKLSKASRYQEYIDIDEE